MECDLNTGSERKTPKLPVYRRKDSMRNHLVGARGRNVTVVPVEPVVPVAADDTLVACVRIGLFDLVNVAGGVHLLPVLPTVLLVRGQFLVPDLVETSFD